MFTGLVEALGRVEASGRAGAGHRLALRVPEDWPQEVRAGDSIAVNGVCLTAVAVEPGGSASISPRRRCAVTTLGDLAAGDPVNLERPLRLGARLAATWSSGTSTASAASPAVAAEGAAPADRPGPAGARGRYLIPKGSVAVDGVSLTVAALDDTSFAVALIPHTLAVTTLGARGSATGSTSRWTCWASTCERSAVSRCGGEEARDPWTPGPAGPSAGGAVREARGATALPSSPSRRRSRRSAAGRMLVVVDDEDRENEGDLVMAADQATPEAINFMAKHGRGLICVPLTGERLDELAGRA